MANHFTKIVSQSDTKNYQLATSLNLQDARQIRAVTRHFTENLRRARIDVLGPLPNGSSILRITAKPLRGQKTLKAHVEVNLSGEELIEFMQKKEFYKDLAALKLNQFTGYIGEQKLMDYAVDGVLHNKAFMKTVGRVKAQTFKEATGKEIVKDKVWAIQNDSGHGIDFVCEVVPYPPKPKYITIDAKATLRAKYGDHATARGPSLSDEQKEPVRNLLKHLNNAINDYRFGNSYHLSEAEFRTYSRMLREIRGNKTLLDGYKATIGLTNGFKLAQNSKYNEMIVFSKID